MPENHIQSLADLLEQEFGVRTTHRLNPTNQTAPLIAMQQVLGANPKRLGFVIVNMGAVIAYIAPRDTVADDFGITLVPNGGTVNMIWNQDFELVALPWYCISEGAGTEIFVVEVQVF